MRRTLSIKQLAAGRKAKPDANASYAGLMVDLEDSGARAGSGSPNLGLDHSARLKAKLHAKPAVARARSRSARLRVSIFSHPEIKEITVNALVATGVLDLVIPERLAIQLRPTDLKPREVHFADGSRKLVRYAGPVKVEMMGRDCVTAALVMGDQVLLGAIPMQAMDMIVHPRSEQLVPNPESSNVPSFLAMGGVSKQRGGD